MRHNARALPHSILMASVSALIVSGCATVPDLGPKPQATTITTLESQQSLRGPEAGWPVTDWWTGYGDAQLTSLIAEGLAQSPDIAMANARVRAADALARQAGAALLPQIGATAQAGGVQQSGNMGIPPQFVPQGIQDTGLVNINASWNLDLWGRDRAALAAATSEAEATRVDAEQARLMLASNIAAAYADLAGYMNQRDSALETQRVRETTATLVGTRANAGIENRGSQRDAESRVGTARSDVSALDEAISLTRHRIAALLGAGPDRGLSITCPQLTPPPPGIPNDAGIALVGRRPDIVAARLRAEAASHRIDQAHAAFYPDIRLSALVGLQALGLGNLFESDSTYGNGGAAITLPIFQGGAISARYRGARADYDTAVARYDQALTTALREVADALTSRMALDTQIAHQRTALTAATEAAELARIRYRAGLSNQLPMLTAEDGMLAIRRSVTTMEARRLALDIALIRALGGGYRAPETTTGN